MCYMYVYHRSLQTVVIWAGVQSLGPSTSLAMYGCRTKHKRLTTLLRSCRHLYDGSCILRCRSITSLVSKLEMHSCTSSARNDHCATHCNTMLGTRKLKAASCMLRDKQCTPVAILVTAFDIKLCSLSCCGSTPTCPHHGTLACYRMLGQHSHCVRRVGHSLLLTYHQTQDLHQTHDDSCCDMHDDNNNT